MKGQKRLCILLALALLLAGCSVQRTDRGKQKDLEYTITDKEEIPENLKTRIAGEKEKPFLLAYGDGDWLYIAVGYGEQDTGGYSIEVEDLYETENAVLVRTCLTGPDEGEDVAEKATFPYIVVRTGYTEKRIISEM